MPAARSETLEYRALRGFLVEMERLRIEFGGESLYLRRIDAQAPGAEFLPHGEIFEKALHHARLSDAVTPSSSFSVPRTTVSAIILPIRAAVSSRCRSSMPFTGSPSKLT